MEKLIVKPSDLIMVNVANLDLDYAVKGKTYNKMNQHMRIWYLQPLVKSENLVLIISMLR